MTTDILAARCSVCGANLCEEEMRNGDCHRCDDVAQGIDGPDEDDDEDFDCGMSHDGQCGYAGSEWCDFECPNRS